MNAVQHYFLLFIGAFIVQNIIFIRFIGLCPFFGVSTQVETSIGMSLAVTFVMTLASAASWIVWNYLLVPFGVGEFLYIPVFILVIASLVQFVEMFIRKVSPPLYKAMGIYLPLITTNCAVLAAATEASKPGFLKLNMPYGYSFIEGIVYSVSVALGFGLAIVMMAAIRDRMKTSPVPQWLRTYPIIFITASLASLAFMGFAGLFGM